MQSYSRNLDVINRIFYGLIVVIALFLSASLTVFAGYKYTDTDTGVTFVVPDGWYKAALSQERQIIDVKYRNDNNATFMYGKVDIYSSLSEEEKGKYSRSDIDNSLLSKEDVAAALGATDSKVSMVTYNGKEYFKVSYNSYSELMGTNVYINMVALARVDNGYLFTFQFTGDEYSQDYRDFESLLNSVEYPFQESSAHKSSSSFFTEDNYVLVLVFSLIMTIAVYSLPIIIYRFMIRRSPVEKKKAIIITIIYAFIGFFIMAIIKFALGEEGVTNGAAIALWSMINYFILVSGKKKIDATETADIKEPVESYEAETKSFVNAAPDIKITPEPVSRVEEPRVEESKPDEMQGLFCRKCGAQIPSDSEFCYKCGTKVVRM